MRTLKPQSRAGLYSADARDDIVKLIDAGTEKGYLTYNEVNNLIPGDVHSPEDLDDLLTSIGTRGIDVLEGQPKLASSVLKRRLEEGVEPSEDIGLDLSPATPEKTNDSVRIYLREMGTVPLLSREGEVDIAKRIEHGQLCTLKALSRSPIVIRQILAIGEDLKRGTRSIKGIVVFDGEEIKEITEEILQNRIKDITCRIETLQKHYKRASQLAGLLPTIPANKKPNTYRRCRHQLGREIVRLSLIIRNLGLTNFERKRLTDRVNKTVDIMRSLDRQISNLEKKIASTRSEELKKDYRKTQGRYRADLERLESDAGVSFQELQRTQREIIQRETATEHAKHELINANGSALVYSTFLGAGVIIPGALAIDVASNAYVIGTTNSPTFPTTPGAFQTTFGTDPDQIDAFVSKLNATGSALVYSTFLRGTVKGTAFEPLNFGRGIAVDALGNAYVTGSTACIDFPTTPGAFQTTFGGGNTGGDAFAAKLNSAGSALVYSTFLGGKGDDDGHGVAIDSSGNAYVSGGTESSNFPTTSGAFQTSYGGFRDAFISKLNTDGSVLVYSTFLGGNHFDEAFGVAVGPSGSAYVTGETGSSNFPTTPGAFLTTLAGPFGNTFVSKLNASGSALLYSNYLGGSGGDSGASIAVDALGSAYVTGGTNSSNFPTTPGAFQTTFGGSKDAFISKFSFGITPVLHLSRASGPPTAVVLISGSGFPVNTDVDLFFNTTDLSLAHTDSNGAFSNIPLTVPKAAFFGHNWITAKARSNGASAQRDFLVQTNWNQFRFLASHTGLNPYENMLNTGNAHQLAAHWIFLTAGPVRSSGARVNGMVFFGSDDKTLYAVNGDTQTPQWNFHPGAPVSSSPAVANHVVYFGSDDHKAYALSTAGGAMQWSFPTNGPVHSSPAVTNGVVYIGSDDDKVYALNATTGALQWSFATGGAVYASPAVSDGVVFVGSEDNKVYALDAATGSLKWSFSTQNVVHSSAAVLAGVVYVGSQDNKLYALDAATGVLKWTFTAGAAVNSSPAIAHGVVYFGSDDGKLYALNAGTGALRWSFTTGGIVTSSPAVGNGVVYVGSEDGNVYGLNAGTGAQLWTHATGGAVDSSPTLVNDVVYVTSNSRLFKFDRAAAVSGNPVAQPNPATLQPNLNLTVTPQVAPGTGS